MVFSQRESREGLPLHTHPLTVRTPKAGLAAAVALFALGAAFALIAGVIAPVLMTPAIAASPLAAVLARLNLENPPVLPLASPQLVLAPPPPPSSPLAGPIPGGYRIKVPRLGIDLAIQEGDVKRDSEEQRTPEGFAFHLPGTAIPGRNGNTFLYAHARRGMFLALWNAKPGDAILVSTPTGDVLEYVVREILPYVAPTDLSTTAATATEQLTLQTSTGPRPTDPRFIVLAFHRTGLPDR